MGLGIEYETAYEGSDDFGFELDPAGALQWRRGDNIFFFAGEALGWRGVRADTWLLEALVGFDEGRSEGDSDRGRLDGLGDGDEGLELVFQARRAFTPDWRYWLVGRAVTGENGKLGSIGIDYNYRYIINDNWQIFGEALYEYYSSDVRSSPIARSNYEAEVGIGFIYVF